jgi:general secretion pathway protein F
VQYEVRALLDDRIATWRLDAADEADARRQVAARNAVAMDVVALRSPRGAWGLPRFDREARVDLGLFAADLAELLDAGLEIVEALSALAENTREAGTSGLAARLLARLRDGTPLSQALEAEDGLVPPLFVGLVRAGERSGGVLDALRRWGDYRRRHEELAARLRAALVYPAVLLVVGSAVTLFLLGVVVPRFATAYRGAEERLPAMTRLMMQLGVGVAAHPALVAAGLAAVAAATVHVLRAAARSGRLELALARLPGIGARVGLFRLSQLHLTLGTLLQAGLPALAALELAHSVMPPVRRPALTGVAEALRRGERWSDALAARGLASPVSQRLLRAGEGTGRLAEMLVRSARHQDQALARWIDRFSRLFEPVLMVLVGAIVGAIVVMLYLPIFDLAGSLS